MIQGDAAGAAPEGPPLPGPRRMLQWLAFAAGTLGGTAAQLQQREAAPAALAWAVLAVAVAAWAWRAFMAMPGATVPRPRRVRIPSGRWSAWAVALPGLALGAALGWSATELRAQARLAERLPAALEGRDLQVTGIVAQLPRNTLQGTRFLFEVESARLAQVAGAAGGTGAKGEASEAPEVAGTLPVPPLISLGWYRGAEPDALLLGPALPVRAGQRWRFTVRLRQPHGPFNPGGFDLELWLFERGIGATGYVRSSPGAMAELLEADAAAPVQRLRQAVRDAIERRLDEPGQARAAGVIAALAIGDQAAIEREDWEVFRLTGVAHLMSISGLHVTMFAWLAAGLVGRLWRLWPRAMLWLPAPTAARWGGVLLALAYALVAGWGVPAQRTVWMLATVALLRTVARRWPLHVVLVAVAAVVAAADPWALLQPGFWLSFVAVGLLAASEPRRQHDTESTAAGLAGRAAAVAREALRTQAVATVGLAPLTLVFFQQVAVVGFAANLLAIPVVTLLVTPLALLGVLLPPLWHAAAAVLAQLGAYLQWLATWPWAVWQAAAAPGWAVAAGLLGGLVAVLPLPWRVRALALPLVWPLLVPPVVRPAIGQFELVALDVGQGTAALVRTRNHLLVYDTGPAFSPEADAGSRLLVPLLRQRGERQVDHLVLSHRDTDHTGGAGALLAALPVRLLSSSLDDDHPLVARARAAGAPHTRCQAGQRWQWDGVAFEVLHPAAADFTVPGLRPNALSCVLRVQAAGDAAPGQEGRVASAPGPAPASSVLLTGDIEAPQEAALTRLAAEGGPALRSHFMLVPHHGSRTSSTAAFLDAAAPGWALAQAGYRSRFGHPAPDVVARYQQRGVALLRSDRCGALTLESGGQPRCERLAARRYWHHRADP